MYRVGEHLLGTRTGVAGPPSIPAIDRSPRKVLMATAVAAITLVATTSGVAHGQPASPEPGYPGGSAEDSTPAPVAVPSVAPAEAVIDTDRTEAVLPRLVVEAGDLWFAPSEITVRADEPTVLVLSGVGAVAHNLMIDDLGLQLHVGPGIESEAIVHDLPPGTYEYYCSIFGHRRGGMYGTLTVE